MTYDVLDLADGNQIEIWPAMTGESVTLLVCVAVGSAVDLTVAERLKLAAMLALPSIEEARG